MQRKGRKLLKSRAGMRGKSGFRCCRLHISRPRLSVLFLLEKMKKPFHRFWASLALAGKSMLKSLLCDSDNTPPPVYVPVAASTHSFYTEAIADCIDFIKRSSSPMDSTSVDHVR
ncbi:hypothetical protein SUGI_0419040 [Cryptomeria japonica]|nr:hypothetical protein SUGI_0419040 [Cryptomeria japonica]